MPGLRPHQCHKERSQLSHVGSDTSRGHHRGDVAHRRQRPHGHADADPREHTSHPLPTPSPHPAFSHTQAAQPQPTCPHPHQWVTGPNGSPAPSCATTTALSKLTTCTLACRPAPSLALCSIACPLSRHMPPPCCVPWCHCHRAPLRPSTPAPTTRPHHHCPTCQPPHHASCYAIHHVSTIALTLGPQCA